MMNDFSGITLDMILPIIITILNFKNLLCVKKTLRKTCEVLTLIVLPILTTLNYIMIMGPSYNEPINLKTGIKVHEPLLSQSLPTLIIIIIVGLVGFILVRGFKYRISPLVLVLSLSALLLNIVIMIAIIIQLFKHINNIDVIYCMLYLINFILCALSAFIDIIKNYMIDEPIEYSSKILTKCSLLLYDTKKWPMLALVLMIPLLIVVVIITVLLGQRPDDIIRAFVETSDWTFSTKTPPPPISVEVESHYLCTVSLKGHEKLVKPTRFGLRHGNIIVVNRQLCVANAFEDLIQEKTPRIHYFIRYIYDKYGYPISKHINHKWQADITYIIMKPLEWIFLIILYLFDKKPENRIAVQYTGKKLKDFETHTIINNKL